MAINGVTSTTSVDVGDTDEADADWGGGVALYGWRSSGQNHSTEPICGA